MKLLSRAISALFLVISIGPIGADERNRQPTFAELLNESGLHLHRGPGFVEIPPQMNPLLPYEFALRHESGAVELRFIVRPLSRIKIDYSDPHNAAPEPDHLFPLLFESIALQLSVGNNRPSSIFSQPEAQRSFNANWAAATVLDLDPEFSANYRHAVLIGIHKKQMADAYTLILYNESETAKPLLNIATSLLTFTPDSDLQ